MEEKKIQKDNHVLILYTYLFPISDYYILIVKEMTINFSYKKHSRSFFTFMFRVVVLLPESDVTHK